MKNKTKILIIDNYDSFTFNLVEYFRKAGCEVGIYRNNCNTNIVDKLGPELIVFSPGPGSPEGAGNTLEIIDRYKEKYPIFGVCLGFQAIIHYFATPVHRLDEIVHGGSSLITHDGKTIFKGLENPLQVGRYHSLGIYRNEICNSELEISAEFGSIVMGIRHKQYPIEGVQFHPESVLTMKNNSGYRLIENIVNGEIKNALR